jgi:hypothetical protein
MDDIEKLDEAQYFLEGMIQAQSAQDERAFRYELSAFLSAARTVLQYAFAECGRTGRLDWYETAVTRDSCLAFLKLQRDDNVHGRPVAPMAVETAGMNPDAHPAGSSEFFFVEWTGTESAVALAERCLSAIAALVAEGRSAGILTIGSPTYNVRDMAARTRERRRRRTRA